MKISLYQVDAFTSTVFKGNPAAVCPCDQFPSDEVMQSIATENNLSETAFIVKKAEGFNIRWFTPVTEVKLCGHATLASAYIIFNILKYPENTIHFSSKSGKLTVTRQNDIFILDFPIEIPQPCTLPEEIVKGLGQKPLDWYRSEEDYLCIYDSEDQVTKMEPDFNYLKSVSSRGIIVSAQSKKYDFISRFFAPAVGINEDPVTGSAHCLLTPFWAKKLNKTKMFAKQVSQRGGEITCEMKGDRVLLSGQAALYLKGEIEI